MHKTDTILAAATEVGNRRDLVDGEIFPAAAPAAKTNRAELPFGHAPGSDVGQAPTHP